ncbi:MAG: hypothetical protein GYB66_15880 [Chloroflexi bacterium]|nr:hypothetical protein [Chloroflexota bacterium]
MKSDRPSTQKSDQIILFPSDAEASPLPVRQDPDEGLPSPNYFRIAVAALLVLVLVLSGSYAALRPWLLQQSRQETITVERAEFDAIITGVSSTKNSCDDAPRFSGNNVLPPTQILCVCGELLTAGDGIHYALRLTKESTDVVVGRLPLQNQRKGAFCHRWEFSSLLSNGRYLLEIGTTTNYFNQIAGVWFDIRTHPYNESI